MKNGEKKKRESMFFFQVFSPFSFLFLESDTDNDQKKKKKLHSSFSLNSSRSGSAGSSPPWRCS